MPESYCGNDCSGCRSREAADCPGCLSGPGAPGSASCECARCCLGKGCGSCLACPPARECALRRAAAEEPERRAAGRAAREAELGRLSARAGVLSTRMNLLAILMLINLMASYITLLLSAPQFQSAASALQALATLAYSALLISLRGDGRLYLPAGCFGLASTLVNAASGLAPDGEAGFALSVSLLCLTVGGRLLSAFFEFKAHAALLEPADDELGGKWLRLWRWMVVALVTTGAAAALTLRPGGGQGLLLFVTMAGAIVLVVVSILEFVYLWRMSALFDRMAGSRR